MEQTDRQMDREFLSRQSFSTAISFYITLIEKYFYNVRKVRSKRHKTVQCLPSVRLSVPSIDIFHQRLQYDSPVKWVSK